uniref:Uncharacterized protein n=3 Tax=Lygus hesperus TaxID=30085 RepID=A0A146KZU5_LYGHE
MGESSDFNAVQRNALRRRVVSAMRAVSPYLLHPRLFLHISFRVSYPLLLEPFPFLCRQLRDMLLFFLRKMSVHNACIHVHPHHLCIDSSTPAHQQFFSHTYYTPPKSSCTLGVPYSCLLTASSPPPPRSQLRGQCESYVNATYRNNCLVLDPLVPMISLHQYNPMLPWCCPAIDEFSCTRPALRELVFDSWSTKGREYQRRCSSNQQYFASRYLVPQVSALRRLEQALVHNFQHLAEARQQLAAGWWVSNTVRTWNSFILRNVRNLISWQMVHRCGGDASGATGGVTQDVDAGTINECMEVGRCRASHVSTAFPTPLAVLAPYNPHILFPHTSIQAAAVQPSRTACDVKQWAFCNAVATILFHHLLYQTSIRAERRYAVMVQQLSIVSRWCVLQDGLTSTVFSPSSNFVATDCAETPLLTQRTASLFRVPVRLRSESVQVAPLQLSPPLHTLLQWDLGRRLRGRCDTLLQATQLFDIHRMSTRGTASRRHCAALLQRFSSSSNGTTFSCATSRFARRRLSYPAQRYNPSDRTFLLMLKLLVQFKHLHLVPVILQRLCALLNSL